MSEWMNNDGSFGDMTDAPEDVKSVVGDNGFKSIGDVTHAYSEMFKLQGSQAEKLNIPENFSDEMRGQMQTSLGRPESAEKYDLSKFKDIIKPEMLKNISGLAFEQGWSQDGIETALSKMSEWGMEAKTAEQETVETQALKLEEGMRAEMGDKFQPFVDRALDTADKLGILETLDTKKLNLDRDVLNAMNRLADQIGEEALKTPAGGGSIETKQDKMARIKANPAFLNNMHPDHETVHNEWLELHKAG